MSDFLMTKNRRARQHETGVSLIELMVALVLGLFLIFGAVTIYNQSRTTFRTTEAVARLQEVGRLALDVLEADVRMANYWGLSSRSDYIVNSAAPGASLPTDFSATQGARISYCGGNNSNWAINLATYLDGSNNTYTLSCAAVGTASATSDTLVVRRASEVPPAALDANRIFLQTSRIQGTMFVPAASCTDPNNAGCIPAAYLPPASESHELIAHAYYVATTSTMRTDVPSLRRKSFGNVNAAVVSDAVTDEEIVPGIEDLQIRLGVDTNGDTNVDQYVNPGSVPAGASVISATIWLRVRSEDREVGFVDDNSYQYADMTAAFEPADDYRRIVVSKTILLRNTRV